MTELKTMSFELNQTQLDAAIQAAMPSLIGGLSIKYTSGRPPKGTTAEVLLSESLVRDAVADYAKKMVNPAFVHFSITFRPTRGEDGLTTTVVASADPIVPDAPAPATTKAPAPEPEAVVEQQPTTTAENTPLTAEDAPVAAEEVTEAAEQAPWNEPAPEASEAVIETKEEALAAEAVVETAEEVTTADVKPVEEAVKPAGRSRLFADLTRPNNAAE